MTAINNQQSTCYSCLQAEQDVIGTNIQSWERTIISPLANAFRHLYPVFQARYLALLHRGFTG
ncbi:MAG: hypothetical protein AB4038_00185 [Prochloraceae cyanobacterium]